MTQFLNHLETGSKLCGLSGGRVLLAVSGGADSVAMLRGMLHLRDRHGLQVSAAHLNHNLRGDESLADAEWLTALAKRLELPLIVEGRDVAAIAGRKAQGLEEAAREVRYAFLQEAAANLGCSDVAVAHTADDQAETILHHVIRGTGVAGLRGMPRTRPLTEDIRLVRPLLGITRAEIEHYLAELGQDFRRDASNTDDAFTRNRLRHSLLPLLEREYNPQVREALRRLGQQADEMQQALEHLAADLLKQAVVDSNETTCRVDCDRLAGQPRHLVRECFARLWRQLNWPRGQMGYAEWDQLAELVFNGGTATFPGNIEARRRGNLVVLRRE